MIRLVVRTTLSDGYTYSFPCIRPVLYESAEAFLVDLESAAKQARERVLSEISFAGHDWDLDEFGTFEVDPYLKRRQKPVQKWVWYWNQVQIMTVSEWFDSHYGGSEYADG